MITTPKIMDTVFDSMERCVVHSNTFGQNDLAMAAALATLHVMEEDRIVENVAALGEYAMASLAEMGLSCPFVDEVRGKGLMFGIDFKRPGAVAQTESRVGYAAHAEFRRLQPDDHSAVAARAPHSDAGGRLSHEVIKLLPPLNVTRADIDWFLAAMRSVLEEIQRVPGAAWTTMAAMAKGVMRAQMEAPARAMSARSVNSV